VNFFLRLIAIWTLNVWFENCVWIYVDLSFEFWVMDYVWVSFLLAIELSLINKWFVFLNWYLVQFKTHYCVLPKVALVKCSEHHFAINFEFPTFFYAYIFNIWNYDLHVRCFFFILNKLVSFHKNNKQSFF
jgi:hypothetical protein